MAREMKNTDIPWVMSIPAHWNVMRNKACFICSKEIIGKLSTETQLLSLTTNGIRKKRPEDSTGKVPESYDTYQIVAPNDIVMCLFDLDVSAVFSGISPFYGMISPAYKVLKCKHNVIPQYAGYWFDFIFDGRKFKHYSKNLRYTLTYDEFATLPIVIPPISEQQRISYYLDSECSRIDSVIEQTRASIEEYKKLKQAVITQAVTKGIRPKRAMKDSGIEWIGEIPVGWDCTLLKRHCNFQTGSTPSTTNEQWFDGDLDWFTPADFNDTYYLVNSGRKLSMMAKEDGVATIIPPNTVMIIGIGGTAGKIGFTTKECSCNQQITAITADDYLYSKYLMYWMIANTKRLKDTALYTTLPIINNSTIGQYRLLVPDTIEEQVEIVRYLDSKVAEIETLINKKEHVITEIEEYKKSLIYEYVTGKKEV